MTYGYQDYSPYLPLYNRLIYGLFHLLVSITIYYYKNVQVS